MFVCLSRFIVSAIAVTTICSAPAFAADDGAGGAVAPDGRRLPTKIVPPGKPQQRAIRPAVQEQKVPAGDAAKPDAPARPGEMSETERRLQAQRWDRRIVREYGVGGYRAYRYYDRDAPLTFLPPVGLCGMVDPFTMQWTLEEAYAIGRDDERYYSVQSESERIMNERKARVLNKHDQALQAGLDELRTGEYTRAVIGLTLAAKLDQGDPACRIHLAQTRLAMGHYELAAKALRRALQLQPKLVYIDPHLDQYYPAAGTLKQLRDTLSEWQKANDATAEIQFLRGYVDYLLGDFNSAHAAFALASDGLPRDELTRDFLEITQPMAKR